MLELDKLGLSSSTQLYRRVETLLAVINNFGISTDEAIETVSTLRGLLEEEDDLPDSVLNDKRWHQLYVGTVTNGWIVRVKPDAFTGEMSKYNGMIGRIVHTSYGRAKINNVLSPTYTHYFNIKDLQYFL
jgi:hypothetical protein